MSSNEDLYELYLNARDLLINKSKNDPVTKPYKSMYEAKELLVSLEGILLEKDACGEEKITINNRLAVVYNLLGNIYCNVEETQLGCDYFEKSVEKLSEDPIHPDKIICYIDSLKTLASTSSKYEKHEETIRHLEKAENAYKLYKEKHSTIPTEFCELFGKSLPEEKDGLEKSYNEVLFFLAQIHYTQGNSTKSAKYCHTTLERVSQTTEFDLIDWALNAATLSQLLFKENAFQEARNHLAAAQMFLTKKAEDTSKLVDETEEVKALKELLRYRTADVYRCWAKYGIHLLACSKERLLNSEGDALDPVSQPPDDIRGLIFCNFKEEIMKEYEESITHELSLTYEDAKPVFLKCQEFLNKAKEYYSLEDHASDYVAIIQDSSALYELLAFFHIDETTQCKLYKRRVDMLESTVNQLNPTYYIQACRELWFELGECLVFIADSKRSQGQDQHYIDKSQQLYSQARKYIEKYLQSFKLQKNAPVTKFPEEHERNIITAYLYLGSICNKLVPKERKELINMIKESIHCYKTVHEYLNNFEEAKETMIGEYTASTDMMKLLYEKLAKIEKLVKA